MTLSFVPPEEDGYPRWVTETQIKYLEAFKEHGSCAKVAKALGVHPNAVWESIDRYKKEAAKRGIAPGHFVSGVAPGNVMGKVTIQRNALGEVERTWERQSPGGPDLLERLTAFRDGLMEEIAPSGLKEFRNIAGVDDKKK